MHDASYEKFICFSAVNVALELLCAVVLFVIALCLFSGWRNRTRLDRMLLRILLLQACLLLLDASAWAFDRVPGLRVPMVIANFLAFSLTFANFYFLMGYIIDSSSLKPAVSRWLLRFIGASCAGVEVLVVVSQFNGILYSIDEQNVYHAGPWLNGMYAFFAFVNLLVLITILNYRKFFEKEDFPALFSYLLMLSVAMPLQILVPELMIGYVVSTIALLAIYVNIHLRQEKNLKERERDLANAQVSIMISQIQPHFLYNTLSVVAALCTSDPPGAQETVIEFSRYLRGNLTPLMRKEPVPFEEEMKHVRTYLSLEKRRFGDRIDAVYEIGASAFRIPALTLQPLVENAIRHGITPRESAGTIVIRTFDGGGFWQIEVEDDGIGFDVSTPPRGGQTHIGIENVRFRLANMCGATLDIDSAPGRGTRAVIRIPRGERSCREEVAS